MNWTYKILFLKVIDSNAFQTPSFCFYPSDLQMTLIKLAKKYILKNDFFHWVISRNGPTVHQNSWCLKQPSINNNKRARTLNQSSTKRHLDLPRALLRARKIIPYCTTKSVRRTSHHARALFYAHPMQCSNTDQLMLLRLHARTQPVRRVRARVLHTESRYKQLATVRFSRSFWLK